MITLLQKKKIKKYDILVIQKLWRYSESARTYNSRNVDFTLKNNEEKTCFYVKKRINSNSWYTT